MPEVVLVLAGCSPDAADASTLKTYTPNLSVHLVLDTAGACKREDAACNQACVLV